MVKKMREREKKPSDYDKMITIHIMFTLIKPVNALNEK